MLRRRIQCRKYKDVQLNVSEHRTLTPPPLVTRMEYNNTELWPGTRTDISWGPTLPRYRGTGSILALSPHICHGIHASTTQQCFSLITHVFVIYYQERAPLDLDSIHLTTPPTPPPGRRVRKKQTAHLFCVKSIGEAHTLTSSQITYHHVTPLE